MYCGSCMHDNRLAASLRDLGHDVVLLPLYTPLRTDEIDVSDSRVYYGGINCYLQQTSTLFRNTPWLLDRLLDARPLLNSLERFAGSTRPRDLGAMTQSVLEGPRGAQRKELAKLMAALEHLDAHVVHLPNLMFAGIAETIRQTLDVPVVCNLAGEDTFIDRLPEPYRTRVFALIRAGAAHIDAFDVVTDYYAQHATRFFDLPADRIRRIPMGIHASDFDPPADPPDTPFTIGYLANIWPAKGFPELCRAFLMLRSRGRPVRLRLAGYLSPANKHALEQVERELRTAGVRADEYEYIGAVDRAQKLALLRSLHVLSVPATIAEPKGYYVLEALATGVPVVEPRHGAFTELIDATGGGLLCEPHDVDSLADTIARLMDDEPLRRQLAARGRAVVHRDFTAERTAAAVAELYADLRQ